MKFLVIQQKMIGDVLASTVVCESLKYHFPNSVVHMVANENTLAVLQGNPFVDHVVVFKNEYHKSKKSLYLFLKSLKKKEYTAVFDAYGKLESNLISLFTKADRKIGAYKWYTSWVYTHTIQQTKTPSNEIPLSVSNRLKLLEPLLDQTEFVTYPKLFVSNTEVESAKKSIASLRDYDNQKLIMISILGSAPYKTYPAEYMAKVLDIICSSCTAKLLFNYIPNQKKEVLEIFNLCSLETQKCIAIDFYADSLRDFIALLSQCDLLIGNEGGAVNMAKALNISTFCIFSPYIIKGAWHGTANKNHNGVHLKDYHPELFGNIDKREIKKNSSNLYRAFEPHLFKEILLKFLKQNCL